MMATGEAYRPARAAESRTAPLPCRPELGARLRRFPEPPDSESALHREGDGITAAIGRRARGTGATMLTAKTVFSSRKFLRLIEGSGLVGTWGGTFATDAHVWSMGLWRLLGLEPGARAGLRKVPRTSSTPKTGRTSRPRPRSCGGLAPGKQAFRLIRADGALRPLSSRHEVYVTSAGRPESTACVIIDATDRNTPIRALAAEARRRYALFDQHRIISFGVSTTGSIPSTRSSQS